MNDSNIKNNYILNDNYILKNDQKRFILTGRHGHDIYLDKKAEDFPVSVNAIMHPLLALLFSLFDGHRNKEAIMVDYSKILGIGIEHVKKFIDDLFVEVLAEKEKKFIKFENEYFFLPHNLFLKNKHGRKARYSYDINTFMIPKNDLDLKSFRYYRPLDCIFEVNFTCFTDCIYCYADRRNKDKCTIPFGRIKEILKESVELGMRTFDICGGELFLYENWEPLVKELIDSGYRPYISTKIPITDTDIKKLKNQGQKEIQLSIDSLNVDEIKAILKVESNYLEKMKNTLKNLEKEKIDVYINTQITRFNDNQEHIKDMIETLFKYKNIKRIKLGHIGRSLYFNPNIYSNISSTYDNIKKIEEMLDTYKNNEHAIEINFSGYSTKEKYILDDLEIKTKNYSDRIKCSGNFYGFIILPNGKVTICEELYFHPKFIIGDIKNQSIMEIWNSERALELYKLSKEKLRDESACKTCPQNEYEHCRQIRGVCWKEILLAYNFDNWDYPDPKCPRAPIPFNKFWLE